MVLATCSPVQLSDFSGAPLELRRHLATARCCLAEARCLSRDCSSLVKERFDNLDARGARRRDLAARAVFPDLIDRSEEGAKNLAQSFQRRCSRHALPARKGASVTRIIHTLVLGLAAVRNANLTISGFIG